MKRSAIDLNDSTRVLMGLGIEEWYRRFVERNLHCAVWLYQQRKRILPIRERRVWTAAIGLFAGNHTAGERAIGGCVPLAIRLPEHIDAGDLKSILPNHNTGREARQILDTTRQKKKAALPGTDKIGSAIEPTYMPVVQRIPGTARGQRIEQ